MGIGFRKVRFIIYTVVCGFNEIESVGTLCEDHGLFLLIYGDLGWLGGRFGDMGMV